MSDKHHITIKKTRTIIDSIRDECHNNFADITKHLPLEFAISLSVHKTILHQALQITESTTTDPRTRLEAMRVASDVRRYIDALIVDAARIAQETTGTPSIHNNRQANRPDSYGEKLPSVNQTDGVKALNSVGEIKTDRPKSPRRGVEGGGKGGSSV